VSETRADVQASAQDSLSGLSCDAAESSERRFYVFLTQRPHDAEAWPLVYVSRELAEHAPDRVSEVVEVRVPPRGVG